MYLGCRLHGSYQALEAGYAIDALVDFTGGIGEFVDLRRETQTHKLQKRVARLHRMDSFLCAAIEVGDKNYMYRNYSRKISIVMLLLVIIKTNITNITYWR